MPRLPTVPMPASASESLPFELIMTILDKLAIPLENQITNGYHGESAVLAVCSLVCKEWSRHAQRLLFERVIISDKEDMDRISSFLATIDPITEKGSWLATSVRTLVFCHRPPYKCITANQLATVLTRTRNLRELEMSLEPCSAFDEASLLNLRTARPQITSLKIIMDANYHWRVTNTLTMRRLISSIPTLRLFEIRSHSARELPLFSPPLSLPLISITINTRFVRNFDAYVGSLLEEGDGTLEVLSLGGSHEPSSLRRLLKVHGPYLRSLSLDSTDLAVLELCTRLEYFHLRRFPSVEDLGAIPRTIKAFAIMGGFALTSHCENIPPPIEHLLEQLQIFPSLKVLTWTLYKHHPEHQTLCDICRARGIELRTTKEYYYPNDDDVLLNLRRQYVKA